MVNLTVLISLTVFVFASFGMVAPAPGGIGAWHFMVIETLLIYSKIMDTPITREDAGAFAFAVHGSMTFMIIIAGFISLMILPLINKDITKAKDE